MESMPLDGHMGLAMVVEDDDAVRLMMCELLQSAGFKVVGCSGGVEAIKVARELHPAVLTLDLHMPGMDGMEVLSRLASDPSTSRIPVVVVSAYSSDRRVRASRQVKAIVSKPFDVDDLCEKVRLAANGREAPMPRRAVCWS